MATLSLNLIAAALGFGAPARRGRWSVPARVEPTLAPARPERIERHLAAARTQPDLQMLEWDGDGEGDRAAIAEPAAVREDVRALEPRRRKLRSRYIAARFPGMDSGFADVPAAIESARLLFEDGRAGLALELLGLAVEESPQEPALALIEIRFLLRDATGFVAAARAFAHAHPGHEAWDEVARLGRALVPGDALFGDPAAARAHEHYGPWPHLPNWIQAPWDLTAEVCAADFHRALALA